MKNLRNLFGALAVMGVTLSTASSFGSVIPLPPGSIVPLAGDYTLVGGTAIATLVSPFTSLNTSKFSGVLTTTVYQNDPNNALGGLTFVYTLHDDATSIDPLERLTVIDWSASPLVNAANLFPASGAPAFEATRTPNGDTIGFNFFPWIQPGTTSAVVLQSNLKLFTSSTASIIDGGIASAPTFAPTPVPEPSTVIAGALLLFPLGASAIRSLRKRA